MLNKISHFYQGTTKRFQLTCKINGAAQDIKADTLKFWVKKAKGDPNADAVISKEADVTTHGENGIALFELTPAETDVAPDKYFCGIEWQRANDDEYVVYDDTIKVLERVSDI